jgi:hypothetical protein
VGSKAALVGRRNLQVWVVETEKNVADGIAYSGRESQGSISKKSHGILIPLPSATVLSTVSMFSKKNGRIFQLHLNIHATRT